MSDAKEVGDKIYEGYKAQNESRQKYYLAIVVGILCGLIGYLAGSM